MSVFLACNMTRQLLDVGEEPVHLVLRVRGRAEVVQQQAAAGHAGVVHPDGVAHVGRLQAVEHQHRVRRARLPVMVSGGVGGRVSEATLGEHRRLMPALLCCWQRCWLQTELRPHACCLLSSILAVGLPRLPLA